ncbi:MAG TPA: phosphatase PAP2 family protein [Candidatus Dormibacteraeota bacterium]|nr:phosphatase PAP2 family protein [Candidatus Dormibacteraeota bacterium]
MSRSLRLLCVLAALSAYGYVRAQEPQAGYLTPAQALHVEAWLPPPPGQNSMANAADVEAYLSSRALIGTARAQEAQADDVLKPAEAVAPRFAYLMGVTLDRRTTPRLMQLMELVRNDAEWLMLPVKKPVASGGRRRPFVDFPNLPKCPLVFEALGSTGSYPSGHAMTGWLWGSILAELAPEFADALLARGIAFGDSRVVCGFHYPSDITGGRIAAAALLTRLHAERRFQDDLAQAKKEVTAALGAARLKFAR